MKDEAANLIAALLALLVRLGFMCLVAAYLITHW